MSTTTLRIFAGALALVALVWILVMGKAILGVLILLAAGGILARSMVAAAPGAPPFWTQSSVLAAGFFGIVAVLTLALFLPEVHRRAGDLERMEEKLVETKTTLESIRFDADGNVPDAERARFESAMSRAKYLPGNLETARDNFQLEIAISCGAALVLVGCGLVIARARRRRTAGDGNASRSAATGPTLASS